MWNSSRCKYWDCLRLNWRVLHLMLARCWLSDRNFVASYDRLAKDYDQAWLEQIRPVTDRLLMQLPVAVSGSVVDLGSGTGYAASRLAERYPVSPLTLVDFSEQMLGQARTRLAGHSTEFIQDDMLAYLRSQDNQTTGLIFSAWAMGYSRPAQVIRESARVLVPGGTLAFIINYADTLHPLYVAFRKCMQRFPEKLKCVVRPHFPHGRPELVRSLTSAKMLVTWSEDGFQLIQPPTDAGDRLLPWLLRTGTLAGFEDMLPLAQPGPVADYFEQALRGCPEPIRHHYAMVVAKKT